VSKVEKQKYDRENCYCHLFLSSCLVVAKPECESPSDCPSKDICYQGSCQDACRFQSCGSNALCKSEQHVAHCECLPGTQGNPTIACAPCKLSCWWTICIRYPSMSYFLLAKPSVEPTLAAGCSDNDECPDYNACRNSKCINPCAVDQPCAPLATCKVVNHNVLCTCPDGYVGSPEISCQPRK
jgi:hypothetical protein